MDGAVGGVLGRLPLAKAVLALWDWAAGDEALQAIFDEFRGRGYQRAFLFSTLVGLVRDALIQHRGVGKPGFEAAEARGELPASVRAVYGKLARVGVAVSSALLARCTARLAEVAPGAPGGAALPACFDKYRVLVLDGKAIKRVARRLKPLRSAAGGLLGGRALVALDARSGLAIAMRAHPDGDANEVAFVGDLVPEVRDLVAGPRLWVADRAFCDLTQPPHFAQDGDAFLVRYHPKVSFAADPERPACVHADADGRRVVEDWGWIGSPKGRKRIAVRRVTLSRPGEPDVILITDLKDPEAVPAADLLALYLERWEIERVFQRVTEVFHLEHLIGTTPQGTIFQFAICLVLYNLTQVVRGYVAEGRDLDPAEVSGEKLFEDVGRQMIALAETADPAATPTCHDPDRTREGTRAELRAALHGLWRPRWLKSPPKKKRPPAPSPPRRRTHASVHRILQAHKAQKTKTCPKDQGG